MQPLFTIGHSQHSLENFIALLQQHNVTALADVRSMPYSRRFSQFNRQVLEKHLPQAEIRYVFLGKELGARLDNPNCYYETGKTSNKIPRSEKRTGSGIPIFDGEDVPVSRTVCYPTTAVGGKRAGTIGKSCRTPKENGDEL